VLEANGVAERTRNKNSQSLLTSVPYQGASVETLPACCCAAYACVVVTSVRRLLERESVNGPVERARPRVHRRLEKRAAKFGAVISDRWSETVASSSNFCRQRYGFRLLSAPKNQPSADTLGDP